MIIRNLNIINFKNIAQATLVLEDGINCFVGRNGAGKTNILDAVYHLSMCKSFFNAGDAQHIRHGEGFFVIQGSYEREDGSLDIYCGLKRGEKKIFRKNGKPYARLSEHIGLLPLVMVSPEDIVLIEGGSEERRRFVDGMISQCDRTYLQQLIRYNKVLQQRNALLKAGAGRVLDSGSLEVWDDSLVDAGETVMRIRRSFLQEFREIFQSYYNSLANGREEVEVGYRASVGAGGLAGALRSSLQKDCLLGYTTCGVHRDDLSLDIGGYPVRKCASQGQKKSFLIALKLAQYDWILKKGGIRPLLLLDDILDKLDTERVARLVHTVSCGGFGQILITDTDRGHLEEVLEREHVPFRLFTVADGEISASVKQK